MWLNNNMRGVTSGARNANIFGAPDFTLSFQWGSRCSIFSFLCSVW